MKPLNAHAQLLSTSAFVCSKVRFLASHGY